MGKKHSKLEAVIGSSYTCPSCQEIFNADTPSKQVNEHIINCSHSPTSLSSDDLFNPINLKSSKKKTISNKNSKLDPLRIKDYIKTRKINSHFLRKAVDFSLFFVNIPYHYFQIFLSLFGNYLINFLSW